MLDIVRAQALALTTEAWNVASNAKQKRKKLLTYTQEEEATLLQAAAEKAIRKRLWKRYRHEDREILSDRDSRGNQKLGSRKSGKLVIAEDLDNRTQSPWPVHGIARSQRVSIFAWRQLHIWALSQLSEISGAEHQLLSAFRRVYASARPPSAYAAWVLVEAVARLRCCIHRWDRADGPALSLILLKSAGDAMMKKTDVYDPRRPVAQKTQEARAAVHGTPGSATALLPPRIEIIHGSDESSVTASMHPHAQHLLASAIMDSCTLLTPDELAATFRNCTEASSQLMDDAHQCAKKLAELYAKGGNYDFNGNHVCTYDMNLSYGERLFSTVSCAAESLLRSRADLKAAVNLLRDWTWLDNAAQTLKDSESDRLDSVKVMRECWSSTREEVPHTKRVRTSPPNNVVDFSIQHSQNSYASSSPKDAHLPLFQAGALVGESVWFGDHEYVVLDKPIAVCWDTCTQRGVCALSLCPGTHARRAEMRYLGQLCDCSSPEECACDFATLHDRKERKSVNWRTSRLPTILDCFWRPCAEVDLRKPPRYKASLVEDVRRLNAIARELRNGSSAARIRRECERFTSMQPRRQEGALVPSVLRSLENEIYNNSLPVLRRWCNMNPAVVRDYWRAEQQHLRTGTFTAPPSALALPPEFASLVDETPCPRPGCPGTLQEDERFVRSVDEASKAVLSCSQRGCGVVIDK